MHVPSRMYHFVPVLAILCLSGPHAHGDVYRDARERTQSRVVPSFLEEQLSRQTLTEAVALPEAVLPEFELLLEADREDRATRPLRIAEAIEPRLAGEEAKELQTAARSGDLDGLLGESVELSALLNVAFVRSPRIRSAHDDWTASLNRYSQAAYLDGMLRQYNAFTKRQDLLLGTMPKQRQPVAAEFPFPAATALRGDLVQTDIRIAERNFAIAVRDTVTDVKQTFYDHIYNQDAIRITQTNRTLLQQMLAVASRKFETARVSYNHVINVRMALSILSNELVTLEEKKATLVATLNAYLDRHPRAVLGPSSHLDPPVLGVSLDELYARARAGNQELQQARYREERVELTIALAKKMNRPDPSLGASHFENRSAVLAGAEPGRDSFRPAPRQPLRPWFGTREAFIQEMRARKDSATQRVQETLNRTLLEVKNAHFAMEAAQRGIDLHDRTLVSEARQLLDVSETEYEGGRIGFLDYLDAQRTWLYLNLALHNARRSLRKAFAELERVVGESLSESE